MALIFTKSLRYQDFNWELNVFHRHVNHTLICLSRGEDLKRQGIAHAYPDISPIFFIQTPFSLNTKLN